MLSLKECVSAARANAGSYAIDPAELHRVFHRRKMQPVPATIA